MTGNALMSNSRSRSHGGNSEDLYSSWSSSQTKWLAVTTILVLLLVTPIAACPLQCQCNTMYYVYCQNIGISDDVIRDTLSEVSPSAKLLDLSSNQISRINPHLFTKLPNLISLNIAHNRISQLASNVFQNLTRLREFKLKKNQIRDLDGTTFTGLNSLTDLDLSENSISSLPVGTFSKLTNLEKLQLQKNTFEQLEPKSFSGLKKLQSLDLSKNSLKLIKEFTFSGLHSLEKLNLAQNYLSGFSKDGFSGLTSLASLDLSFNEIPSIDFLHGNDFSPSITILDLSHNVITAVSSNPIQHNRNVRVVNLSHNKIQQISRHAFKSLSLDSLNLTCNHLSEIDRDMFKDTQQIINLDFSQNRIKDIKTGAFDSFRERVYHLSLHGNDLTIVHTGMFRGMKRLRSLDLSKNKITSIDKDSFLDMTLLEKLDLSGNKFVTISFGSIRGPSDLRYLDLTGNPIREISGFSFDEADRKVLMEVNSSVDSLTQTSARITWPYKQGSQLYWSVSVMCVKSSSSKSDSSTCTTPPYSDSLKPFNHHLTLTDLQPDGEYFVCVNPVFLSPDTKMTQCTMLHTARPQADGKTTTRKGRQLDTNNAAVPSYLLHPLNSVQFLLLCLSILLRVVGGIT